MTNDPFLAITAILFLITLIVGVKGWITASANRIAHKEYNKKQTHDKVTNNCY